MPKDGGWANEIVGTIEDDQCRFLLQATSMVTVRPS